MADEGFSIEEVLERYPNGYDTDLSSCARCGGDHDGLAFYPLDNPSDDWAFWAMCPEKQQPILGAIAPTPQSMDSMEAWRERPGDSVNG